MKRVSSERGKKRDSHKCVCKGCDAKLRPEDPHSLCWEHIGVTHTCSKCRDLAPFAEFESYQHFLAKCWDRSRREERTSVATATKADAEGSDAKETRTGSREDGRCGAGVVEDGGPSGEATDTTGIVFGGLVEDGNSLVEPLTVEVQEEDFQLLVFNKLQALEEQNTEFRAQQQQEIKELREECNGEITSSFQKVQSLLSNWFSKGGQPKRDNATRSRSSEGDFEEIEMSVMPRCDEVNKNKHSSAGLSPGKKVEQETRFRSSPFYDDEDSIRTETLLYSDQEEVFSDGEVVIQEEDNEPLDVFSSRLESIHGGKKSSPVKEKKSDPVVVQVVCCHEDKNKEKKTRDDDEEDEFDQSSIPLRDIVKSCLDRNSYVPSMCDTACLDMEETGPEISAAAVEWAKSCLRPKLLSKNLFEEGMWAHIVMSDEKLYKKATVPGVKDQVKSGLRFPRIHIEEKEVQGWKRNVKDTLGVSSVSQAPSTAVASINKNYQFIVEDFRRVAMTPEVDTYVKQFCLQQHRAEPKIDKQSLAFKTQQATKLQYRIMTFIKTAVQVAKGRPEAKEEGPLLPVIFTTVEKAMDDLGKVTGRLHGLSLRRVRAQVLNSSGLSSSDKEALARVSCLPAKSLFANRIPGCSGVQDVNSQTAKAKEEATRLARKRPADTHYQGDFKKPRFDKGNARQNNNRFNNSYNNYNQKHAPNQSVRGRQSNRGQQSSFRNDNSNNRWNNQSRPSAGRGRGGNK